jgi:hypothetical protein
MKLSQRIYRTRTDRPDEWSMDAMAADAARLEKRLEFLQSHAELFGDSEQKYDELCAYIENKHIAHLIDPDQ